MKQSKPPKKVPEPDSITIIDLIKQLQAIKKKHGNVLVDVLTDLGSQVEQPCGGIAYSSHQRRVKIIPRGF